MQAVPAYSYRMTFFELVMRPIAMQDVQAISGRSSMPKSAMIMATVATPVVPPFTDETHGK